jgi:hypothetical protein
MVQSFRFAIVRLAPGGVRDERINVGAIIFRNDEVDVRLPRRLDKIRVLSGALDQNKLRELIATIDDRDAEARSSGIEDEEARLRLLDRVGPLTFSSLGSFRCNSASEYEARVDSIMQSVVEPEPALKVSRSKKSKVLSQLKRALREHRVLARPHEDISSHRVVSNMLLADGLVADLVLKNGKMHVFETVDVSEPDTTPRKVVTDVAVSALILEQARITFGSETRGRLVYEASTSVEAAAKSCLDAAQHQGAELYNWSSTQDKVRLITDITSLATPLQSRRDRERFSGRDHGPRLRLA